MEIAALVFAACDLETCVVLRQVSSFWYCLFQETNLGPKMYESCPWMFPGGDILTWQDCVLVFAARMKSFEQLLGDVEPPKSFTKAKMLIGRPFDCDEKMPIEQTLLSVRWTL